ncbi:MAG: hypothetical protein AAB607_01250 [Patescibacteria group bacterium]
MERLFEFINSRLKENQRNIILGILLFLIISLSFGLGYLANRELSKTNRAPIIIEKCN